MEMEDELELQAQVMAEKALAALPEAARAGKIAKVKEGILKRLKAQAISAAPPVPNATGQVPVGNPAMAPVAPPPPTAPQGEPPPPENDTDLPEKLPGIEVVGDELWFSHVPTRRSLRERVIAAHAAQKILVASPATEIKRICPGPGRILGAGAVLRLGGSLLGGYGEADINYAYRQLSRALHPDKNPDIPEAHDAFKRLTDASAELKEGLEEQRSVLRVPLLKCVWLPRILRNLVLLAKCSFFSPMFATASNAVSSNLFTFFVGLTSFMHVFTGYFLSWGGMFDKKSRNAKTNIVFRTETTHEPLVGGLEQLYFSIYFRGVEATN